MLSPEMYQRRLLRLDELAEAGGWGHIVVYADREHSANLAYLTGFDPRFEEAMAVIRPGRRPTVLVGNECWGLAGAAPVDMDRIMYQDFSLPSQPRDRSEPLGEILAKLGVDDGGRVGVIGWKQFDDPTKVEIPAFIVDELRRLTGTNGTVHNVADLLMNPSDGLRVINEVDQLAAFEYAACHTSQGVRRLLFGLRPGVREDEAVQLLEWNGMPLSCHLMLTSGERASYGLLSPGDKTIEQGDRFTVAFGIWGALNCRAGFVVEDSSQLPVDIADYVDKLVKPYFETVVAWYEALHVGQTGGTLHEIVERRLGDPFFGIFLNPGHQISLDEWVNSPVAPGSDVKLRSGMALQVDIIPATGTDYFTTNIEDGIAIGDESLRREFADRYPEAWGRITARRRFMIEVLGIQLHPDVMPFSNIPAYLPPFLLRPEHVMTVTR